MIELQECERVPIKNNSGYSATKDGQIIGKRGKPLIGSIDRCGYREVILSNHSHGKRYLVHRLILSTFQPIDGMEKLDVNHIDGNKLNNSLDNLEWCTRSENIIHSFKNGLQRKITNQYGTYKVLSLRDIELIKQYHLDGMTDKEISLKLNCSREVVSKKIRGLGLR